MFRRRSARANAETGSHATETEAGTLTDPADSAHDAQAPKGRPTPRRSDHARPRVYDRAPATRKEAAVLQRQRQLDAKAKAKEGMKRGDERYMLARDRGPLRSLVRDVVDSRISLGTMLMPMALAVLLLAITGQEAIYQSLNLAWLGLMVLSAIDWAIMSLRVTRRASSEFPAEKRGPGLVFYLVQRSLIPRRWRQPKPAVRLGEKVL